MTQRALAKSISKKFVKGGAERAGQDWDVKTHQAAALEIN